MSVNNILLVFGSLYISSTAWLMITVSDLLGDVKVIRFQVSQNSQDLKDLKAREWEYLLIEIETANESAGKRSFRSTQRITRTI